LLQIAEHNHASGNGVKVTPAGLNINSDLPIGDNNVTGVRTIRLSSQGSAPAEATDLGCIVNVGGDLYWINGAGTPVQLTTGGAINIASVGTIGGDYGQPGVAASVAYSDTTKTFTFLQDTGESAELFVGDINIANAASGALSVSIGANAATASYALILPVVAPSADTVLAFDGTGQATFRSISGTSGEVTVSASSTAFTLSLPSTITKNITFSGTTSFTGGTSGRGIVPLGAVLATFPNLTGAFNCVDVSNAGAEGFVQCNGQTLVDATSPMNGAVIPNINNNVFLMGNTTSGSSGGANTKTLTTTELPAHTHSIDHGHANSFALGGTTSFASTGHTHDMDHIHQWSYTQSAVLGTHGIQDRATAISTSTFTTTGVQPLNSFGATVTIGGLALTQCITTGEWYTAQAIDSAGSAKESTGTPSATGTVSLSGAVTNHTGSSGSAGSGSAFDIRPSYISARYIMRVK
jgi:hypothetical protein